MASGRVHGRDRPWDPFATPLAVLTLPATNGTQRGVVRPVDGDRDGTAHWDTGAFEAEREGRRARLRPARENTVQSELRGVGA